MAFPSPRWLKIGYVVGHRAQHRSNAVLALALAFCAASRPRCVPPGAQARILSARLCASPRPRFLNSLAPRRFHTLQGERLGSRGVIMGIPDCLRFAPSLAAGGESPHTYSEMPQNSRKRRWLRRGMSSPPKIGKWGVACRCNGVYLRAFKLSVVVAVHFSIHQGDQGIPYSCEQQDPQSSRGRCWPRRRHRDPEAVPVRSCNSVPPPCSGLLSQWFTTYGRYREPKTVTTTSPLYLSSPRIQGR